MTQPTDTDRRHLARAIEIAQQGRGWVSPNPLVGAVIDTVGATVSIVKETAVEVALLPALSVAMARAS